MNRPKFVYIVLQVNILTFPVFLGRTTHYSVSWYQYTKHYIITENKVLWNPLTNTSFKVLVVLAVAPTLLSFLWEMTTARAICNSS